MSVECNISFTHNGEPPTRLLLPCINQWLHFCLREGAVIDEGIELVDEGTELIADCGDVSLVKLRNYLGCLSIKPSAGFA